MKNPFIIAVGVLVLVIIGAAVFLISQKQPEQIACTLEAKICPDGSAVGRTGPKCEFTPCPITKETASVAKIGQKISIQGVSITPLEVMEDSRCPIDVICVWAGTVRLRINLESEGKTEEAVLTLGEPIIFMNKQIQLANVAPAPHSKQTKLKEEYRFNFLVTQSVNEGK